MKGQRSLSTSKKSVRRLSRSAHLRLLFMLTVFGGCAFVLLTWFHNIIILHSSSSSDDVEPDITAPEPYSKLSITERSHPIQQQTPQHQQQQLKLPTPVILLGFPKSGTTSIFHFFTCSGVRTQHFCCCNDTSDHPPCQVDTMANCILNNTATAAASASALANNHSNNNNKFVEDPITRASC